MRTVPLALVVPWKVRGACRCLHSPAWFLVATATMLVTYVPEPWIPAYFPVPPPNVNVPLSVSVIRHVVGLAVAVKLVLTRLNVKVPPGRTIVSIVRADRSYPPAVKAPVAITLSLREAAVVLMIRRCSLGLAPGLALALA